MSEEQESQGSPLNNPFVGPRTFTRAERHQYFGRDREARDLLSLVIAERQVLFYAMSGAGKSSLINTRLLPQLTEEEGFATFPVGRVSGELPEGVENVDNIFTFNLILSLECSQANPQRFTRMTLPDFLRNLATNNGEDYFYEEASEITRSGLAEDETWHEPPHILVVDQFEEIITTHLDRWQDRETFFNQLGQAMAEDPLLWVLLTLREDFVAALDPYAPLLPGKMRARFYMQRMEAEAAQLAVEKPAQLGNKPFAPGVAAQLVDNLRQIRVHGDENVQLGQFVEPVQLQVVCFQLWENLKSSNKTEITAEDLEELGNVDKALAQFYEQALAAVLAETAVSEIDLRTWFDRRLITEAETRGTVYQGAQQTAGMDNKVVISLANRFLLRAEIRAGGTWYELVHDRFIAPIVHANQTWRLQQSPLVQAAELWDRAGRPRDKLYEGDQLKEALAGVDMATAEPLVRSFLRTSQDAQSQRDLAATQAMAEEQMQRAKAEARTAKILRRFAIGLALVLLLAISAAVVAYSQSQEAGRQSQEASNQRATALAEGTRAAEANGTAVAAAADVQTVQSSTLEELQAQATQDVLDLLIIASESETEVDELRAIAATAAAAAVATQTAVANQTIAAATATAAAATAEANATATALAACVNDVTVESRTLKLRSGTEIASILTNADFTYEVVLRNSGTCTWEDGLQWVYVDGEAFGYEGDGETINTPVLPEETYPINLDLRSPDSQDTFRSSWQLVDAEGNPIGNPLNFSVVVALPPTATPAATATSSVVVTDLTFADEVLAATCEYQGIDWSCLVRITPYGGAGGPYTVLVEDQPGGQFTQLSGSSPYTYNARARRCANFSQNVRVIDNGASPPIIDSSPLYIRPDDYFPGGCTE